MKPKTMASESFERFNIFPSQVASIIDHYLFANNFSLMRATFRMEASSLFANSSVNQDMENVLNTYNVSPRPTVSNDVVMNGTSAVVPPFRVCNKITSGHSMLQ
ncbi:unnamed protein product [Sphenostylis stenocarpa]|uniref:LisH domain-containing protein n=1 Tax=Sphenostylis stenocarpa TaxID=92480 RepID=A0AA86VY84_9FABA|nr:unnamed protein product [Sphenostylis stenocarpa]